MLTDTATARSRAARPVREYPDSTDRKVAPTVRRRQVVAYLAGGMLVSAVVAGFTGTGALWGVGFCLAAALTGYLLLVARVTRMAAEREMCAAFGNDRSNFDWESLDCESLESECGPHETGFNQPGFIPTVVGNRDLVRFILTYALGWVLTPFVAIVRLVSGDLDHLKHHGVIERLVRIQHYGRSQSLRLLTVGAVAAAGVTTIGAIASPAFAGQATSGDTPVASAGAAGGSYTVGVGDTLGAIAARFGTTVAALASANGISDPNMIFAGQVLALRGSTAVASAGTAGGSYTVRVGDSLGAIAARLGTTVTALASANGISDPNMIFAGQVLALPGGSTVMASDGATGGSYTVRVGETLGAIAAHFGTTVTALASANGISDPNMIFAGQVLALPGGSTPVASAPVAAVVSPAIPAPVDVSRPTVVSSPAVVSPPTALVSAAPAPPAPVLASPAPAAPAGSVWAELRQCESSGDYAANTGNGFYGAYQFSLATWQGLGLSGLPSQAPPDVQDQAAHQLQAQGGWGQWPACSQRLGLS